MDKPTLDDLLSWLRTQAEFYRADFSAWIAEVERLRAENDRLREPDDADEAMNALGLALAAMFAPDDWWPRCAFVAAVVIAGAIGGLVIQNRRNSK